MADELKGLPVFFEEFEPGRESRFDAELDELVKAYALEKRVIGGVCNLSAAPTEFSVSSDNLREDLVSRHTRSINRHRQVVCALSVALFGHAAGSLEDVAEHVNRRRLRLYTAEAHSPLYHFLKARLDPGLLVCSEYFGPEHRSGEVVGGTLHEDLQQTSFEDESFDIVLTFEVFEHIPDAPRAEREVVRILRPGGIYCFTVPFLPASPHDVVLAERDEQGRDHFHAEPQYHGDPLRPEQGVLVYRLFSFHDLKRRFEGLGCRFRSYRFWSKTLGILDDNGWVHVVAKPPGREAAAGPGGDAAAAELRRLLAEREAQLSSLGERLSEAEAELRRAEDVAAWVQSSRSWRAAAALRRLGLGARRALRLARRGGLGGAIESPAESALCDGRVEVAGWFESAGAPVTLVEAFLDDRYLGRLSLEPGGARPHGDGPPGRVEFRDSIRLGAEQAGIRTLTVRGYDARGRQHTLSRRVRVAA